MIDDKPTIEEEREGMMHSPAALAKRNQELEIHIGRFERELVRLIGLTELFKESARDSTLNYPVLAFKAMADLVAKAANEIDPEYEGDK